MAAQRAELVIVLAHAGHWIVSLLYVAPVLVVVVALAVQSRRERGREPDDLD